MSRGEIVKLGVGIGVTYISWYLAGPMTGLPESNYPAFTRACRDLRKLDLKIISPHETLNNQDGAVSWHICLKHDLRTLTQCGGLILLPGWAASRGARLEFQTALALDMPIMYFEPPVLVRIA